MDAATFPLMRNFSGIVTYTSSHAAIVSGAGVYSIAPELDFKAVTELLDNERDAFYYRSVPTQELTLIVQEDQVLWMPGQEEYSEST